MAAHKKATKRATELKSSIGNVRLVNADDELNRVTTKSGLRQLRDAAKVLTEAADTLEQSSSEFDPSSSQVTQAELRIAYTLGQAERSIGQALKRFDANLVQLHERVQQATEARAEGDDVDDPPIEAGDYTVVFKQTAGRSTLSWKEVAKSLWRKLNNKKPGPVKSAKDDPAEKWAEGQAKAAPKSAPGLSVTVELRS